MGTTRVSPDCSSSSVKRTQRGRSVLGMPAQPRFLTPAEVADLLKVSTKTLANRRSQGLPPLALKIGGRVRYPREALEEWLAKQPRLGAGEAEAVSGV